MKSFKLIISASGTPDGSAGLHPESELVDSAELNPRDVYDAIDGATHIHIPADSAKYVVEEEHGLSWRDATEELGDRDHYDVGELFRWLGY